MQQIIGVAGMVACFLASSFLLFQDKLMASIWSGLSAFLFLGLAVVDLGLLRGLFAGLRRPAAGPAPKGSRSTPSIKLRATAVKAAAPTSPALALLDALKAWKAPEAFTLPWPVFLGLALVLLASGQAFIFLAGKYLAGWGLTVLGMVLGVHYFQSEGEKFSVPLVSTLPKMIAWCGLGLLLEIVGFYLGWIQRPHLAFVVIIAGTICLTVGLWWHLELPRRGLEGPGEGLRAFEAPMGFGRRDWLFKVGAVVAAIVFFIARGQLSNYDQMTFATILGTLAILYTFPWAPYDILSLDRFNPWARRALGWGLLGLALALAQFGQVKVYGGLFQQGLGLFAAAIACFALATPLSPSTEADEGRPQRFETILLVAVFLLALVLRAYKTGHIPVGIEGDEAGYGWWGEELRQGRFEQVFIHAAQPLYWYFAGASFLEWFGINPLGVRMHSVFHGALGILTFYLFLRLFFTWRTAIVTTLLLAFSTWHLHFSRFGHYNVTTHFAQGILFYYLFRAARRQSLVDFVLAGVGLSLAAQSHVAARLLPFFLTVFVGYLFFFHRTKFMRLLPGICIIVIASWVLLSGPWIQFIKNPLWMMGRIKDVSITNNNNSNAPSDFISGIAQSFKSSMLMFNFRGDSRPRDNFLAPDPMLDHWTSILFVLGFGLAVVGWRRPLYGFALIAFFGTLVSSVMSVEAPQSLRTAGNITFCYLLVAFAIDRFRWSFEEAFPKGGRYAFLLLAIPLALLVGKGNIKAYFDRAKTMSFDGLATEIGMKAQELGPGSKVLFQSEFFGSSHPPVFFFGNGVPVGSQAEAVALLPSTETPDKGLYFAFSDRYKPGWKTARTFYPEGEAMAVESWLFPGTNDYEGWWLSKAKIDASHGLRAAYQGLPAPVERADRVILGEGQAPLGATSAAWTGSVYSTGYCFAKVFLETPGRAEVWVNGQRASSSSGGTVQAREIRLPGGLSSVKVTWQGQGQPGRLFWERRPIAHVGQGYFTLQGHEAGKKPIEARSSFHAIKPRGLLQRFYTGPAFKGEALIKVDPVLQGHWITSGYGPISWRWTGTLSIAQAGMYQFRLGSGRGSRVTIDGRPSFAGGNLAFEDGKPVNAAPFRLSAGKHRIEVLYQTPGEVEFDFEWSSQPDAGAPQTWELVPAEVLEPEELAG